MNIQPHFYTVTIHSFPQILPCLYFNKLVRTLSLQGLAPGPGSHAWKADTMLAKYCPQDTGISSNTEGWRLQCGSFLLVLVHCSHWGENVNLGNLLTWSK